MSTESWHIGYDDGYMQGWNDAMDEKPAQREWVGLTGHEQKELMSMSARDAVFATEIKLKEKNI